MIKFNSYRNNEHFRNIAALFSLGAVGITFFCSRCFLA